MASFYRASVEEFLAQSETEVLARLEIAYANRGYTSQYSDQTLTWERDIHSLRATLGDCVSRSTSANSWGLILEFSIPRKEMRIDTVLLIRDAVVILEAKTGQAATIAKRQIEEYSLLLHYFHKGSEDHRIVPVIVSPEAHEPDLTALNQREFFPQLPTYWVAQVLRSSWDKLSKVLIEVDKHSKGKISAKEWDDSPYFPVPNIVKAALALKTGLSIREIAHSEASEHEIENVRRAIQVYVDRSRSESHHAICFLTGVPGSGKGQLLRLFGIPFIHASDVTATRKPALKPSAAQLMKIDRSRQNRSDLSRAVDTLFQQAISQLANFWMLGRRKMPDWRNWPWGSRASEPRIAGQRSGGILVAHWEPRS